MLSYRHFFHAGNHADLLKHFVYAKCLELLLKKEKALLIIDTHAGAGFYSLENNKEWQNGVGKIYNQELPKTAQHYKNFIQKYLPKYYIGSPFIAQDFLREQDKLYLFEKHPTDFEILKKNTKKQNNIFILKENGFDALKKLLPPPSRRGIILIDPPYETLSDYENIITALKEGLKRFQTGVYLLWYPILNKKESAQLPKRLLKLSQQNYLNIQFKTKEKNDGFGLFGSGVFIINPPFQLFETTQEILPIFSNYCAMDFEINAHIL